MSNQANQLRETLDHLQSQLQDMREVDPALADQLAQRLREAQELLEGKQVPPAKHRSLVDGLGEAVLEFEASHPSLAANLGSVINALSQMGI